MSETKVLFTLNELNDKLNIEDLSDEEKKKIKIKAPKFESDQKRDIIESVEALNSFFEDDDPDNWTLEQKENLAYLTEKLKKEFEAEVNNNPQLQTTIKGNPSNPTGEDGKKMIERMNKSHRSLTDWGLDFAREIKDPKKILDIGCGGGAAIANLLERYPMTTVYGIDISEVSVEKSKEYNSKAVAEGKVIVSQAGVDDLPFTDDSFDLIISVESYFFWPDFKNALKQIRRVLKPNGMLLLIAEMYKGIEMTSTEKLMHEKFAHNLYSVEEFEEFLKETDFSDIKVHTKDGTHWICVQAEK